MTTFSDWVQKVFNHPVREPEWYWDREADTIEPSPSRSVAYLTRLFKDPEPVLAPYTDGQLNQGFWYLVHNACSSYMFSLTEGKDPWVSLPEGAVPWPERREGIRAIATLFERLFAKRCSEHLSHIDEPGASPLNSACYMWWDLFPAHGQPDKPTYADLDAELLGVMKLTLALDSVACQESALHGLGHWQMYYPAFVHEAVDEFLARRKFVRPALRE